MDIPFTLSRDDYHIRIMPSSQQPSSSSSSSIHPSSTVTPISRQHGGGGGHESKVGVGMGRAGSRPAAQMPYSHQKMLHHPHQENQQLQQKQQQHQLSAQAHLHRAHPQNSPPYQENYQEQNQEAPVQHQRPTSPEQQRQVVLNSHEQQPLQQQQPLQVRLNRASNFGHPQQYSQSHLEVRPSKVQRLPASELPSSGGQYDHHAPGPDTVQQPPLQNGSAGGDSLSSSPTQKLIVRLDLRKMNMPSSPPSRIAAPSVTGVNPTRKGRPPKPKGDFPALSHSTKSVSEPTSAVSGTSGSGGWRQTQILYPPTVAPTAKAGSGWTNPIDLDTSPLPTNIAAKRHSSSADSINEMYSAGSEGGAKKREPSTDLYPTTVGVVQELQVGGPFPPLQQPSKKKQKQSKLSPVQLPQAHPPTMVHPEGHPSFSGLISSAIISPEQQARQREKHLALLLAAQKLAKLNRGGNDHSFMGQPNGRIKSEATSPLLPRRESNLTVASAGVWNQDEIRRADAPHDGQGQGKMVKEEYPEQRPSNGLNSGQNQRNLRPISGHQTKYREDSPDMFHYQYEDDDQSDEDYVDAPEMRLSSDSTTSAVPTTLAGTAKPKASSSTTGTAATPSRKRTRAGSVSASSGGSATSNAAAKRLSPGGAGGAGHTRGAKISSAPSSTISTTAGGDGKKKPSPKPEKKAKGASLPTAEVKKEINSDVCQTCQGVGQFICCDSCPRAFHFTCCQPPVDPLSLPDEWYCNKCLVEKKPPKPAPKGIFKSLIDNVNKTNPTVFTLPEEIRSFFRGVETNSDGEYENEVDYKPSPMMATLEPVSFLITQGSNGLSPAGSNSGGATATATSQQDEDLLALTDSAGKVRLCFKCQKTAFGKKPMVHCDHCPLYWHLDCLSPPLASPPPSCKKWMCPNHAYPLQPKIRKRKLGPVLVNVKSEKLVSTTLYSGGTSTIENDGDIEVVSEEEEQAATAPIRTKSTMPVRATRAVVEAAAAAASLASSTSSLIATGSNVPQTSVLADPHGVTYRIPERTIKLDFFAKCQRVRESALEHQLRTEKEALKRQETRNLKEWQMQLLVSAAMVEDMVTDSRRKVGAETQTVEEVDEEVEKVENDVVIKESAVRSTIADDSVVDSGLVRDNGQMTTNENGVNNNSGKQMLQLIDDSEKEEYLRFKAFQRLMANTDAAATVKRLLAMDELEKEKEKLATEALLGL